jgi:two-component system sensor kinase FixL
MPAPPAQLLEVLELATDQAHRAGLIIRNLREFVSKGGDQKKPLDLDQIILDVISLLKYELQTSGVRIDFSPGCHSHRVIAAKIQVEQVLINMVRNSLEAIENANTTGGHIILQSRILPNNSIEVTVSDNGPGVNPEILEDIFNPFQTSKKTGMGIGLSLSRSIIEMHGGKLWVDRNCQNGALFGFELPIST